MDASASAFGKTAFDFLERLEEVTTLAVAHEVITRALADFGIEYFAVAMLPDPRRPFEHAILGYRSPVGWFDRYLAEDYARADPVLRLCRQSSVPFQWSEAPYDPMMQAKAARVMSEAREHGMKEGLSVPIHSLGRYQACFSVSGRELELPPSAGPAIHLIAHYAFDKLRELVRPQPLLPDNPLSPREREILCWSAAGKTAADIGEILSITERTVTAHVVSACHKLERNPIRLPRILRR